MTSLRHNGSRNGASPGGPDDELLDAARDCLLAVGWKRTTLTDVARRAGVSRMTIYRRWPDMQTLLSDLMTREWSGVAEGIASSDGSPLSRLAAGVAATVTTLRENDLFRKIVHVDPELLLPYLLDRRGRTQDSVLVLLESVIAEGQRDGTVRAGDPGLLARSVLLTAHGFAISAQTMTQTMTPPTSQPASRPMTPPAGPSMADLDAELAVIVERYLAP